MTINGNKFDENGMTAVVTGGASGIAKEFTRILHEAGANVVILDITEDAGNSFVKELNSKGGARAVFKKVNVTCWEEQKAAFEFALKEFGRIDYVCPIAGVGERSHMPTGPTEEFVKPDLTVMDINLQGLLYTCSLGIQAFRRQEPNRHGFRGKIIALASVCGFYHIKTMPIYTASKHGVIGYVKTFGQSLPEEKITINSVCPFTVETNISTPEYYAKVRKMGILVPMDSVQEGLTRFLGKNQDSGECLEISPTGAITPFVGKTPQDDKIRLSMDFAIARGNPKSN